MLLYARDGEWDEAEIDYRALTPVLPAAAAASPPLSPQEWRAAADTPYRVVIAFAGLAPRKISESITILTYDFPLRIALPTLVRRNSAVARVALFDNSGEVVEELRPLESLEEIALRTFERRKASIYTKTVLRAISKTVAASISAAALREAEVPVLGELLQLAAVVTEQADLRSVRYLPGRVYFHDTLLTNEGAEESDGEVRFLSADGVILCRHPLASNPSSRRSRLHIESAVCLQ